MAGGNVEILFPSPLAGKFLLHYLTGDGETLDISDDPAFKKAILNQATACNRVEEEGVSAPNNISPDVTDEQFNTVLHENFAYGTYYMIAEPVNNYTEDFIHQFWLENPSDLVRLSASEPGELLNDVTFVTIDYGGNPDLENSLKHYTMTYTTDLEVIDPETRWVVPTGDLEVALYDRYDFDPDYLEQPDMMVPTHLTALLPEKLADELQAVPFYQQAIANNPRLIGYNFVDSAGVSLEKAGYANSFDVIGHWTTPLNEISGQGFIFPDAATLLPAVAGPTPTPMPAPIPSP